VRHQLDKLGKLFAGQNRSSLRDCVSLANLSGEADGLQLGKWEGRQIGRWADFGFQISDFKAQDQHLAPKSPTKSLGVKVVVDFVLVKSPFHRCPQATGDCFPNQPPGRYDFLLRAVFE